MRIRLTIACILIVSMIATAVILKDRVGLLARESISTDEQTISVELRKDKDRVALMFKREYRKNSGYSISRIDFAPYRKDTEATIEMRDREFTIIYGREKSVYSITEDSIVHLE